MLLSIHRNTKCSQDLYLLHIHTPPLWSTPDVYVTHYYTLSFLPLIQRCQSQQSYGFIVPFVGKKKKTLSCNVSTQLTKSCVRETKCTLSLLLLEPTSCLWASGHEAITEHIYRKTIIHTHIHTHDGHLHLLVYNKVFLSRLSHFFLLF